jgi:hypothetical protein
VADGYLHEWDIPMFEVPPKYRPKKKPDNWPRWRKYKGKRTSCDDCIRAIAKDERRFASEPATHTREDADGKAFYCSRHATDRKADSGEH